jgi:hypothetical protein
LPGSIDVQIYYHFCFQCLSPLELAVHHFVRWDFAINALKEGPESFPVRHKKSEYRNSFSLSVSVDGITAASIINGPSNIFELETNKGTEHTGSSQIIQQREKRRSKTARSYEKRSRDSLSMELELTK